MTLAKGFSSALIGAFVLGTVACAPGIRVTRLQPARFNLGATKKIAVLEVTGPGPSAGALQVDLQRQIVQRGYYQLINAVNRGLSINISSGGARVDVGGIRSQVEADVYVIAHVTGYDFRETSSTDKVTKDGKERMVTYITPQAEVEVNFQVVKADGVVVVFQDYNGDTNGQRYEAGTRSNYRQSDLLKSAMEEAVGRFLGDVTPAEVVEKIELDNSDPLVKPGVELAEAGDLNGAEREWRQILDHDGSNAAALYNFGVLLETRGEFDGAAQAYQKAFGISPKPLYRDALDNLNRRITEAQSLQQKI